MIAGVSFDSYYGQGDSADIEAFEILAGIVFPEKYKEVSLGFNGAFILNKPVFNFYNRLLGEDVTSSAGMFLPFGELEGSFETMEMKYRHPPEGFVQDLIIFSVLGNGDALCFDYHENRLSDDPAVMMWHHEAVPGSDSELSFVASSFSKFLENYLSGRPNNKNSEGRTGAIYLILRICSSKSVPFFQLEGHDCSSGRLSLD